MLSLCYYQPGITSACFNYIFLQLMKELDRITGVVIDAARREWTQKWVPRIIEQAVEQVEAATRSAASTAYTEIASLGKTSCQ